MSQKKYFGQEHVFTDRSSVNSSIVLKPGVGETLTIEGFSVAGNNLSNGKVLIGDSLNVAQERSLSGSATVTNTGVVSLSTTGVTPGSYTTSNITVSADGRISSASNGSSVTSLSNSHILVGNVSNIATDVTVSGDVSLVNTGAVTLATVNSNVGSFTASNITVNAKGLITAASSNSSVLSNTLTNAHVLVGNGSNIATDVAVSGDVSLANTGAVTLANTAVTPGSYTLSSITVDSKGRVTSASSGSSTSTLTNAHIFVGNVSNVATDVALSGDATISNTGSLTLANTAVTPASYTLSNITVDSKGRVTAASSSTNIQTTALTNTHIRVGNGSNIAADVAVSGDVTIANTGAITLANSGVTAAYYPMANVTVDAKGRTTVAAPGIISFNNKNIVFNDAGAIGQDGDLIYDKSTFLFQTRNVSITSTTASTAYTNGSTIIAGGVGIAGKLFLNNTISTKNPYAFALGENANSLTSSAVTELSAYWSTPTKVGSNQPTYASGRYTVTEAGLYMVGFSVMLTTSTTLARNCFILVNGVSSPEWGNTAGFLASDRACNSGTCCLNLANNDYVSVNVFCAAPGSSVDTGVKGTFWIVKVG